MENNGILKGERLSALIKTKGVLAESIARSEQKRKILREFKEQNNDICLKIGYLISEGVITKKQVIQLMKESAIFVVEHNKKVINEGVYNSDFIGESLILERVYSQINESWIGDKWNSVKNWVGDKAEAAWNGVKKGAEWVGDKVKQGAEWVGDKVKQGAEWVGDKAKAGWKWAKNRFNNLDIRIALRDGVLDPNFEFDKIEVTVTETGEVVLMCHNTRRVFFSEDCVLKKGGLMEYNGKQYKWSSAMAVSVSFFDAVVFGGLAGAALPAAGGAITGAIGGAGMGLGGAAALGFTGLDLKDTINAAKDNSVQDYARNISQNIKDQMLQRGNYGMDDESPYDGYDEEADDFYSNLYETINRDKKQMINEIAATLICATVGAIGGGIFSAVKNKNNVIYYADGTYKSKQGDISGYWDGTAEKKEIEKMNNGEASPETVEKINSYIEKQDEEPYEGYGDESISFYDSLLG